MVADRGLYCSPLEDVIIVAARVRTGRRSGAYLSPLEAMYCIIVLYCIVLYCIIGALICAARGTLVNARERTFCVARGRPNCAARGRTGHRLAVPCLPLETALEGALVKPLKAALPAARGSTSRCLLHY